MSKTIKINMVRLDDHLNFKATDERGNSIVMDGSPAIGGNYNGVSPLESLLMGLAGCSSIDVVLILKKMKQTIQDIKVDVEAIRTKDGDASSFKTINLHFQVWGEVKENKLAKAIDLSMKKYCSVSKILEKSSTISSSYTIH